MPFNSPVDAEATVKRFLGKPGVAGFLITSSRHKPVHANEYMRLYGMLEEAGQVLAFHSHLNWQDEYTSQLNRFISMHAISFVLCNLVHLTNWVINGLPERFPKLNVMWIESGLAWLPFIMQRLDHEYLMRSSEAPLLKRMPSDYIREMFFTAQPMEHTSDKLLEATFDAINAGTQLLYASDWPHWISICRRASGTWPSSTRPPSAYSGLQLSAHFQSGYSREIPGQGGGLGCGWIVTRQNAVQNFDGFNSCGRSYIPNELYVRLPLCPQKRT